MEQKVELVKKYFSENNGFGKDKDVAIELLKNTIKMLNENNINYCLICGTLLGYMRHNDFIPWDDDIDLIVDESIFNKLPDIVKKYDLTFLKIGNYLVKTCFKDKAFKIPNNKYDRNLLNKNDVYNWPFIDLFIYKLNADNLIFFNKKWNKKYFFPSKEVTFLNMLVNIPCDPSYFLNLNYGSNCMTILKSNSYIHKVEKNIRGNSVTISFEDYIEANKLIK